MLPPIPFRNPLMDLKSRLLEHPWVKWLETLVLAINASALGVGTVSLVSQAASAGPTSVETPTLPAGLYRASYTARVTRAAGVSSSLTVALGWTDGGVSCSQSGAAMTGNTVSTTQSGIVVMQVDAGTPVQYTLTYASVGVPAMQYGFRLAVEQLS